jgi:hypothetical protein
MVERRAATVTALAAWTSVAHAHGEEAVLIALAMALAALTAPFALFLFFWRSSLKSKAILCAAYVISVPSAFYAGIALALDDSAFLVVLFGIPLLVWVAGVSLSRTRKVRMGLG